MQDKKTDKKIELEKELKRRREENINNSEEKNKDFIKILKERLLILIRNNISLVIIQ